MTSNHLRWSVQRPDGPLEEIREFRARILHDGGRRPAFRDAGGRFRDPDPLDGHAHHALARLDGRLVAAVRVVPLDATDRGVCERLLGTPAVEALLARVDLRRGEVWEGSGWVVDPGCRARALGARVLAAGTAVAEALGRTHLLGAAGVRYGQYVRVRQLGYRAAPELDVVPVPRLADEVRIVYGPSAATAPGFRGLVAEAADTLELPAQPADDPQGHPI